MDARVRPAYHELNLSPSGEWSVLAFRDYRGRVPFDAPEGPRGTGRRGADRRAMDAEVRRGSLAPADPSAARRVGVSAVVEAWRGARTHAVTSLRMFSRDVPWGNGRRSTLAEIGGTVGGADAVTGLPDDTVAGQPGRVGRGLARHCVLTLISGAA